MSVLLCNEITKWEKTHKFSSKIISLERMEDSLRLELIFHIIVEPSDCSHLIS